MNKVIIIGGGISGMYAAERLAEKGVKVVLVEAKDHLGGNILTYYDKDVSYETGAARFNTFHTQVMSLLKKYQLHIAPIQGTKLFHPILCGNKVDKDISYEYILKVIKYSDQIAVDLLKKLTFGQLCEFALGYEKTKKLIESFGYNAEFLIANAYSSIRIFKEDFNGNTQYYTCVEGLSELVRRMELNLVSMGVQILKVHMLTRFKWLDDHFQIDIYNAELGKNVSLKGVQLILAMPKKELIKLDFFSPFHKTILESVTGIHLHRVYAKYSRNWMKEGVYRTTTDLQIRQFIPIDTQKGVAMVSYSDMFDADYWKIYADMGEAKLEEAIKKQLKQLFPEKSISKTEWIRSYFWKDGVHCWNAGIDPAKVRKELQKIHPNLCIVGETYSLRQGWIEGALDTVNDVISKVYKGGLIKEFNNYKDWMASFKKITKEQLETAKNHYPQFKWVLLKLPEDKTTRIVDVTEWMNLHPGGVEPFVNHMYEDISHVFKTISNHFEEKQKLKQHVHNMVDKYTIGILSS